MQTISSIILALYYMVLSCGINISLHWCHDEIKDVHIIQTVDLGDCPLDEHNCCGDTEHSDSSCCSHEEFYFQVDDFQLPVNKDEQCCLLISPLLSFQYELRSEVLESTLPTFAPAPVKRLYLKENQLIFYG